MNPKPYGLKIDGRVIHHYSTLKKAKSAAKRKAHRSGPVTIMDLRDIPEKNRLPSRTYNRTQESV